MPFVGIGVGIGRQRFGGGIFAAYAARVAADGGVTEAGACVNAVSGISLNSSLLLVPSGYKSGVVYSQIPTNGDGDLTFTRASDATRVNSDGEIEVVGSGVPRLDYSQGSCPSLLLEPQRTNLQAYSNSFISNWTLGDVTTSVGESTLIDGQSTILMTENTANAVHRVVSTIVTTFTIGQTYTMSFYAKSNGSRNIGLRTGITGTSTNIIFNPNTQAVVSLPSGFTANITPANNGYYRYSITATASVSSDLLSIVLFSGTSLVYTGSGESIYISACQTEAGAYPSTYIPTTSATVTRLSDACSKTGISSLIGQTEGTLYWEGRTISGVGTDLLIVGDITNSVFINITSSNQVRIGIRANNALLLSPSGGTIAANNKIALAYKSGDIVAYLNGIEVITNSTSFTFSDLISSIEIGRPFYDSKATQFNQKSALFTTRLSNAELAELTTL